MRRSTLMQRDRAELIRRARRMRPEERLVAFLHHCELLAQMAQAGVRDRAREASPAW
jgi:hypothetical protein